MLTAVADNARKNNKKIMAVVVIVIMIGFVGGTALQQLLKRSARQGLIRKIFEECGSALVLGPPWAKFVFLRSIDEDDCTSYSLSW